MYIAFLHIRSEFLPTRLDSYNSTIRKPEVYSLSYFSNDETTIQTTSISPLKFEPDYEINIRLYFASSRYDTVQVFPFDESSNFCLSLSTGLIFTALMFNNHTSRLDCASS